MRRLFRITLLALVWANSLVVRQAMAQDLIPSDYIFPLRDVAGYYSANFGEMRENHFHSGVDFKTDGVEGKQVVAVADGYVSRIVLSPTGYGKALYLTHPNGTTTVYAHLQRFAPEIEQFVALERQRLKQNRLDLSCDSLRFRFRQGEEIGRSGNSGTSFGPHLHFEIRDTRTQRTQNPISAGVYRPKDAIPPYLFRLHYVEVDTLRGVPVSAPLRSYELVKRDKNHYSLKQEGPIEVGRNGYFVLEASDRKDEVSNRYGLYRLCLYEDKECLFEYRMDAFSFDRTRYCNAVSFYPLQSKSRNEVIRLMKLDDTPKGFYPTLRNRGLITLEADQQRSMRIDVMDDCGNCSQLSFLIVGKSDDRCFRAQVDTLARVVDRTRHFRYREDGFSLLIPRGALYESLFYHQERLAAPTSSDSTLIFLSPTYRLLDRSIPLHRSIFVAIECFVPVELQKKVCLGGRNGKGKLTCLGGSYRDGMVEAEVSSLGDYYVVADTLAPRITPSFRSGELLREKEEVRIRLSDNFSGIRYWAAYVDGVWTPWDYHPVRGYATLRLSDQLAPGEHQILLVVTDPCGNQARWEGTIRR